MQAVDVLSQGGGGHRFPTRGTQAFLLAGTGAKSLKERCRTALPSDRPSAGTTARAPGSNAKGISNLIELDRGLPANPHLIAAHRELKVFPMNFSDFYPSC